MQNKKVDTENIKARAYVRVSTLLDSQKDSPEHQKNMIQEVARMDGIIISDSDVYEDRGTATNIIEREDVQQMVEDAKNGEFNMIYFAALSRFSRDTLDAVSLKRILVNVLGVRVVSIEDMYDSGKDDNEMIFTIISSVNQKQSENTSRSVKRGLRESAKLGNFTGSIAPFGYKKVNKDGKKTLEIVEEHATIVKQIYDLYVNKGVGDKNIANHLNDLGIPSAKGNLWGVTTVTTILKNPNYTGYLTSSKLQTQVTYDDVNDLHNRRKKLVHRPEEEWERSAVPTHEAIISLEMFEQAKQLRLLRGGGKRGGRRASINVFSELIFCKECGTAMVTMSTLRKLSRKKEERRYRYLMCSKRRRQGEKGCSNSTWIPYEETRDGIIQGVINRVRNVISLDSFNDQTASAVEYSSRDFDKEIKKHEKVIEDNRRLLFEIRRQHMLKEIDGAQYDYEKSIYEKEIAEAEKKIKSLSNTANQHKNREKLRAEMEQALGVLSSLDSYEEVDQTQVLLSRLIERIEVGSDGEVDVYSVLGQL